MGLVLLSMCQWRSWVITMSERKEIVIGLENDSIYDIPSKNIYRWKNRYQHWESMDFWKQTKEAFCSLHLLKLQLEEHMLIMLLKKNIVG